MRAPPRGLLDKTPVTARAPCDATAAARANGRPLKNDPDFYRRLFYPDCFRLGLMHAGDEQDPMRRWTAHCQRHFMEKVLMMNNGPDTWSKHFRGDIVKDARGHHFVPTHGRSVQKRALLAQFEEALEALGASPP